MEKTQQQSQQQPSQQQGQESGSRWQFSRKFIEDESPSRKDGISLRKEASMRRLALAFCQDVGCLLRMSQFTVATGFVYWQRFFINQSLAKNDPYLIASACLLLAGKVEENFKSLQKITETSYFVRSKKDPKAAEALRANQKLLVAEMDKIVKAEELLLVTMNFDFFVSHPYRPLCQIVKDLGFNKPSPDGLNSQFCQIAWNFANDSLRTTMCLQQLRPLDIAVACINLAASTLGKKLPPSPDGQPWWGRYEIRAQVLHDIEIQLMSLYKRKDGDSKTSPTSRVSLPATPSLQAPPQKASRANSTPSPTSAPTAPESQGLTASTSTAPVSSAATAAAAVSAAVCDTMASGATSAKEAAAAAVGVGESKALLSSTSESAEPRPEALAGRAPAEGVAKEEAMGDVTGGTGALESASCMQVNLTVAAATAEQAVAARSDAESIVASGTTRSSTVHAAVTITVPVSNGVPADASCSSLQLEQGQQPPSTPVEKQHTAAKHSEEGQASWLVLSDPQQVALPLTPWQQQQSEHAHKQQQQHQEQLRFQKQQHQPQEGSQLQPHDQVDSELRGNKVRVVEQQFESEKATEPVPAPPSVPEQVAHTGVAWQAGATSGFPSASNTAGALHVHTVGTVAASPVSGPAMMKAAPQAHGVPPGPLQDHAKAAGVQQVPPLLPLDQPVEVAGVPQQHGRVPQQEQPLQQSDEEEVDMDLSDDEASGQPIVVSRGPALTTSVEVAAGGSSAPAHPPAPSAPPVPLPLTPPPVYAARVAAGAPVGTVAVAENALVKPLVAEASGAAPPPVPASPPLVPAGRPDVRLSPPVLPPSCPPPPPLPPGPPPPIQQLAAGSVCAAEGKSTILPPTAARPHQQAASSSKDEFLNSTAEGNGRACVESAKEYIREVEDDGKGVLGLSEELIDELEEVEVGGGKGTSSSAKKRAFRTGSGAPSFRPAPASVNGGAVMSPARAVQGSGINGTQTVCNGGSGSGTAGRVRIGLTFRATAPPGGAVGADRAGRSLSTEPVSNHASDRAAGVSKVSGVPSHVGVAKRLMDEGVRGSDEEDDVIVRLGGAPHSRKKLRGAVPPPPGLGGKPHSEVIYHGPGNRPGWSDGEGKDLWEGDPDSRRAAREAAHAGSDFGRWEEGRRGRLWEMEGADGGRRRHSHVSHERGRRGGEQGVDGEWERERERGRDSREFEECKLGKEGRAVHGERDGHRDREKDREWDRSRGWDEDGDRATDGLHNTDAWKRSKQQHLVHAHPQQAGGAFKGTGEREREHGRRPWKV